MAVIYMKWPYLILYFILFPINVQSNGFEITRFEPSDIEEARIHDIKTIQIAENGLMGFLKCTDECYSLNAENFPSTTCDLSKYLMTH